METDESDACINPNRTPCETPLILEWTIGGDKSKGLILRNFRMCFTATGQVRSSLLIQQHLPQQFLRTFLKLADRLHSSRSTIFNIVARAVDDDEFEQTQDLDESSELTVHAPQQDQRPRFGRKTTPMKHPLL